MTTGQRIKAARKAAGMTQKELGDKLGLSFQSIAQWENDLRNPKYETLERLADALDIHVSQLLGDSERKIYFSGEFYGGFDEYVKNRESGYEFTDGEIAIVRLYNSLNANGKHEAIKRIEELTEIPRYRHQDAPPPRDTTPAADGPEPPPEGPQEGE